MCASYSNINPLFLGFSYFTYWTLRWVHPFKLTTFRVLTRVRTQLSCSVIGIWKISRWSSFFCLLCMRMHTCICVTTKTTTNKPFVPSTSDMLCELKENYVKLITCMIIFHSFLLSNMSPFRPWAFIFFLYHLHPYFFKSSLDS